jgi:hypothetical protein
MSGAGFDLPADAARAVIDDVTGYGTTGVETGGFFAVPRDEEAVSMVALAGTTGIVRERLYFQISERALDRLFSYADEASLWLPAQFHSHAEGAFLSRTDKEHGLSVDGFVSAVVPDFAGPPAEPSAWGWWEYHSRLWHQIASPQTLPAGEVRIVLFDEDGVRER